MVKYIKIYIHIKTTDNLMRFHIHIYYICQVSLSIGFYIEGPVSGSSKKNCSNSKTIFEKYMVRFITVFGCSNIYYYQIIR